MALFLSVSGISPAILIFFQPTTPITSNYLIVNHLDYLFREIGSNSLIYRVITPNFNHCYRMIAIVKDTDIS